jgi:predicted Holliday junction resolvase-like endonuclease
LVVFDGLCEGHVKRVVFVEIKTGTSSLSGRERLVRAAVHAGRVEWVEFRPALGIEKSRSTRTLKSARVPPRRRPK